MNYRSLNVDEDTWYKVKIKAAELGVSVVVLARTLVLYGLQARALKEVEPMVKTIVKEMKKCAS